VGIFSRQPVGVEPSLDADEVIRLRFDSGFQFEESSHEVKGFSAVVVTNMAVRLRHRSGWRTIAFHDMPPHEFVSGMSVSLFSWNVSFFNSAANSYQMIRFFDKAAGEICGHAIARQLGLT